MFARSPHALGPILHTILETCFRDFPGGPVVLRLCSLSMQGRAGLIPGQGTNSPNALWHGQKFFKWKKKKRQKTEVLTQKDAIKHRRDFSVSFQCLKTRWCYQQCVSRGHVYNPVPREGEYGGNTAALCVEIRSWENGEGPGGGWGRNWAAPLGPAGLPFRHLCLTPVLLSKRSRQALVIFLEAGLTAHFSPCSMGPKCVKKSLWASTLALLIQAHLRWLLPRSHCQRNIRNDNCRSKWTF